MNNANSHDFVSGLLPRDEPLMSRDERSGHADAPVRQEVGICRSCGADVPAGEWFERGNTCYRCR